jgi:thioredoxin 1
MKPLLKEIEKDYEGKVEFKQVDVETETSMASQFGIMSIPTFVILKDGKEVARKLGAMPKDLIRGWIDSSL